MVHDSAPVAVHVGCTVEALRASLLDWAQIGRIGFGQTKAA
jgi:hypothetical protein